VTGIAKLEDLLPAMMRLARIKMEKVIMSSEKNELLSGSAAVILFTALSSTAAIATALLPFVISN
jgi:hypothetical protein